MNIIADRLRTSRKIKGIKSQKRAADEIGMKPSTYANWEHGKAVPPVGWLIRLAEFYNCSTDFLLGLDQVKHDEAEVLERYRRLSAESRQIVRKIIEAMSAVEQMKK